MTPLTGTIYVNFSFYEADNNMNTKKAVCIVAIFRADYNATTGNFDPSTQ